MSQLLVQIVKHNGYIKNMEKELNLDRTGMEDKLKALGLGNNNRRRAFCWEIQSLAERFVIENSSVNNADLNDMIVEDWNQKKKLKISKEAISAFFDRSLIANDKQKHAFNALCAGSLESYKVYANEDPTLFSELLIRYLLYFVNNYSTKKVYDKLLENFFDKEAVQVGCNTLQRLGFYMRNGKQLQHNITSFLENLTLEESVFSKGLTSILLPMLKKLAEEDSMIECFI